MKTLANYLFILLLAACGKDNDSTPPKEVAAHLQYFGFTLIDTAWDDPSDTDTKTNYADEVHSFTNLADMLVVNPDDDLRKRLDTFRQLGLKAVLHLNSLFFVPVGTNSPSGTNYNLHPDFEQRWHRFTKMNSSCLTKEYLGALYMGEEPSWNGISYEELNAVANLLESTLPEIPTLIVEAHPALKNLTVPESVDWIGFNHYFIKNPATHPNFQWEWQMLKSKRSNPRQRILMIMDSHYIESVHHTVGNISIDEMNEVAHSYFELAKSDELVVGILGYFWPNGFDTPTAIGARGMPENVLNTYKEIGNAIIRKDSVQNDR